MQNKYNFFLFLPWFQIASLTGFPNGITYTKNSWGILFFFKIVLKRLKGQEKEQSHIFLKKKGNYTLKLAFLILRSHLNESEGIEKR